MKYARKDKYNTRLKKECDGALQRFYTSIYPICLICEAPTDNMHHYIQKAQSNFLRYDERNLIPICMSCHTKHHKSGDPRIVETILIHKGYEWADELEFDRRKIFKFTVEWLEAKLSELKEG